LSFSSSRSGIPRKQGSMEPTSAWRSTQEKWRARHFYPFIKSTVSVPLAALLSQASARSSLSRETTAQKGRAEQPNCHQNARGSAVKKPSPSCQASSWIPFRERRVLTAELEEQTTGGGRLAGVDVTADNDGKMLLLSPAWWEISVNTLEGFPPFEILRVTASHSFLILRGPLDRHTGTTKMPNPVSACNAF